MHAPPCLFLCCLSLYSFGWRADLENLAPGRPALSWGAFWGDTSPYCRDGVVRGRFTLSVPS